MCSDAIKKLCTKCKEGKSANDFSRKGKKANGEIRFEATCKTCKKLADHIRNKLKNKSKKGSGNSANYHFSYIFSLAKEGPDLKGAIDICIIQQKIQNKS